MPMTIDWLSEKKNTLHIRFIKPWTWDEFYGVYDQGRQIIETVDNTVNIVMDFRESGGMLPPSALTHFKKAAERSHPRRGVVVLVSKRMMLVKSIVNVLQKVAIIKSAMLFALDLDEAKAIINHLVEDKPDTLPLR